jgi:hypothetical protein
MKPQQGPLLAARLATEQGGEGQAQGQMQQAAEGERLA